MLQRIRSGIFGTSLIARILFLTSSSILAQLIVIASLPLVSRLFSPAELGMAALVTAVLNFAVPVICLRYDAALPLARKAADAARLVWICLAVAGAFGTVLYLIFRVLQANDLLGFGILPDWTHWIVLAGLPGVACFALGQAWWLRWRKTALIGANLILRAAAHNGTRIAAGVTGGGIVGLMIAEAAMALSALYMAMRMPWRRICRVSGSWARLLGMARQWRRFPLIEGPSTVLNGFVVAFLPVPLVAMLYGPEAAGWFAIAVRIGSIPIGQIGSAISNATYMDFSEAARRGDYDTMRRLFYGVFRRLLVFALIPMIAFAVLAPLLAGPILGPDWAASGTYLALMTPWLYAQMVVAPLSRIVSVLQRQDLKLIYDFSSLAAALAAYFIADRLGLPVERYVLLFSLLTAVSYGIYFAVLRYALRARMRQSAQR